MIQNLLHKYIPGMITSNIPFPDAPKLTSSHIWIVLLILNNKSNRLHVKMHNLIN